MGRGETSSCAFFASVSPIFPQEAQLALEEEVRSLVQKGAVETVLDKRSPGFYARLFVVPKRTGGFRPILDLSPLNVFLRHIRFRMETTKSVRLSLMPGDWVTSLDLTDAYFHVLIHRSHRKWLRFAWHDQVFLFRALPFGLSQSPWIFTIVVRQLCAKVHSLGIRMRVYLDDWAIMSQSREECSLHTETVLALSQDLGFGVNLEKSDLDPAQKFLYLGMQFDTVSWSVAPAPKRLGRLLEAIQALLLLQSAPVRRVAAVYGMLESVSLLIPLGGVLKREFLRAWSRLWSQARDGWEVSIPLVPWFREATLPFMNLSALSVGVPIVLPDPMAEVFTDASLAGWGAHFLSSEAAGVWSYDQSLLHINMLEMLAVQNALREFDSILPTGRIQVRSDNTTVVSYIQKQGGTHSPSLSVLAERILTEQWSKGRTLTASHIEGKVNILADLLSRGHLIVQTEWTLAHQVLRQVWALWGKPWIDLFATKFSKRLPVYVSPVPDPEAWQVDALAFSWRGLEAYAFPPFPLIPEVLRKARQDQPSLILIAPDWPAQSWYADLLRQSQERKLALQILPKQLIQPRSGIQLSNPQLLKLTAWKL